MKVLFFIPEMFEKNSSFQKEVVGVVAEEMREIHRSLSSFSRALIQNELIGGRKLAVIIATENKDLEDIHILRPLLCDIQLILLLPCRNPSIVTLGHSFFPRFLSYTNDNFKVVAAVLEKMIQNSMHDER